MARREGKVLHYGFVIVAACMVISSVTMGFVFGCSGLFYAPVSSYFGVPQTQFVLYWSVMNLVLTFSLPVMGNLIVRVSRRVLLTACALLLGGCMAAMSLATQVWHFYLIGAVMGFAFSPFVYIVVPTFINDWFAKDVSFYIGLCMSFTGLVGMLFNPTLTQIINSSPEGWREGYRIIGLLIVVLTVPFTAFVLRDKPSDMALKRYGEDEVGSDAGSADASSLGGVEAQVAYRSRSFKTVLAFGAIMALVQTINNYLPGFATSFAGTYPEIAAASGYVSSVALAGAIVGTLTLGIANNRSVRLGTLIICLTGIAGMALMLSSSGLLVAMLCGAFLFGYAYGGTGIETPLLTRTCFGSKDYAIINSRVSAAGSATAIVSALVWSMLADSSLGYAPIFAIGIVALVVSYALMRSSLAHAKELAESWQEG